MMRRFFILTAVWLSVTVGFAVAQTDARPAGPMALSQASQRHIKLAATGGDMLLGESALGPRRRQNAAGKAIAFRFWARTGGRVRSVTVYVGPHSMTRKLVVGLYSDRRGHPGSLLTSGSLRLLIRRAWNVVAVHQAVVTSRRFYWIAVLGRGGALNLRLRAKRRCTTESSEVNHVKKLPRRWRTRARFKACPISAYVNGIQAAIGISQPGSPPPISATPIQVSLPSGVALRQIDGGPNYYCANGLTYACEDGWDNPSFFPILDDYAFYSTNSTSTFKDLGLNTDLRVTGGTSMSYLRNAGVYAIQAGDATTDTGNETVGAHVEEPGSWSDITNQATSLANQYGIAGRLLQPSFTWTSLYYDNLSGSACGGNGTMTMQEVMSCTSGMPGGHHLDIATDDLYWFAGSVTSADQYDGGMIYANNGTATPDEMARGSNYGDMVDTMRSWVTQHPAPVAPYIETEDGLVTGGREITPPELNWAVWSTIVHGARMVIYFGTTSNYGSVPTFGFSQNVLPGQSISMYKQGKSTNTVVQQFAPIINSPFALNYASVTPAAYVFPTPHRVWSSGIDVMAKYDASSNSFYIFATPRGSESQTNINAKFTIGGNYSGSIPVTCACSPPQSGGSVTVSNHTFSDTFAHAWDTHIYGPIPNQ
jgi:hypothetical protein